MVGLAGRGTIGLAGTCVGFPVSVEVSNGDGLGGCVVDGVGFEGGGNAAGTASSSVPHSDALIQENPSLQ